MSKYVGMKLGKVHDDHVISEYYCGGCGYPITDHDSFCSECGGALRMEDASEEIIDFEEFKKLLLYKPIVHETCEIDYAVQVMAILPDVQSVPEDVRDQVIDQGARVLYNALCKKDKTEESE